MELLTPGIYLQQVKGIPAMEGVSTTNFGFVGVTEKGPINVAKLVTSFREFVQMYGGFIRESTLAYAVKGYFENGGKRLFISRVVHSEDGVPTSSQATGDLKVKVDGEEGETSEVVFANVDAREHGSYYNNYKVAVYAEEVEEDETPKYTIEVRHKTELLEKFTTDQPELFEEFVNNSSKLVRLTVIDEELLKEGAKFEATLEGGKNGTEGLTSTDLVGDEEKGTGLYAFDTEPVNFVAIPNEFEVATLKGIESYVESRGSLSAIVYAPRGLDEQEAREFFLKTAKLRSSRVFPYYVWGEVSDPLGVGKSPTKYIDLTGHVSGQIARTIGEMGIGTTPAGTKTVLRGVLDLERYVTDGGQTLLNPEGINVVRFFESDGIVIWGGRTLTDDPEFRYISTRTTVDYVGQTILAGTRFAIFESNGAPLRKRVAKTAESFLRPMWQKGGLRGQTEEEAFFVVCDETNNSKEDVDNGRLYCDIGIATQKPAEFIVFRLSLI